MLGRIGEFLGTLWVLAIFVFAIGMMVCFAVGWESAGDILAKVALIVAGLGMTAIVGFVLLGIAYQCVESIRRVFPAPAKREGQTATTLPTDAPDDYQLLLELNEEALREWDRQFARRHGYHALKKPQGWRLWRRDK